LATPRSHPLTLWAGGMSARKDEGTIGQRRHTAYETVTRCMPLVSAT
jgi:hypothetical protein